MTPATIAAVVAEIEAYGRGGRTGHLTWRAICEFAGFSQVSLWKKVEIKAAFSKVQRSQRADATPTIPAPRTADARVSALLTALEELKGIIRAYDEQWALYEHNVHRLGIEGDELRRPLDPVAREMVRSRRIRVVR